MTKSIVSADYLCLIFFATWNSDRNILLFYSTIYLYLVQNYTFFMFIFKNPIPGQKILGLLALLRPSFSSSRHWKEEGKMAPFALLRPRFRPSIMWIAPIWVQGGFLPLNKDTNPLFSQRLHTSLWFSAGIYDICCFALVAMLMSVRPVGHYLSASLSTTTLTTDSSSRNPSTPTPTTRQRWLNIVTIIFILSKILRFLCFINVKQALVWTSWKNITPSVLSSVLVNPILTCLMISTVYL